MIIRMMMIVVVMMMICRNLYFGGKNRQHVTILVGMLLPAFITGITFCMNVLWFITGSTQYIHFGKLFC